MLFLLEMVLLLPLICTIYLFKKRKQRSSIYDNVAAVYKIGLMK
jgi:hypothetical protein